jgi:hypothetical protein
MPPQNTSNRKTAKRTVPEVWAHRPSGTTFWSQEAIIEAIKKFVALHGCPPQRHDFEETPWLPNASTVYRRFGSLQKARLAAGVDGGPSGQGGPRPGPYRKRRNNHAASDQPRVGAVDPVDITPPSHDMADQLGRAEAGAAAPREAAVTAWCARHGLTFDVTPTGTVEMDRAGQVKAHWRGVLRCNGQELPLVVVQALERGPLTVTGLLMVLGSEPVRLAATMAFDEWAGVYGFATDNPDEFRHWKSAQWQTRQLTALLGWRRVLELYELVKQGGGRGQTDK